jgi:hypothetical protein
MYFLRDKFYNLKWKLQRFHRGYSDNDAWSIRDWFLLTMPKALDTMRANLQGSPYGITFEEWQNILERMSFCFKEAHEDTCSQTNEYEDMFDIYFEENENGTYSLKNSNEEIYNKWSKRQEAISAYQTKMLHEGLALFKKYFWDLWD